MKSSFLYARILEAEKVWFKLPNTDDVPTVNGEVLKISKSIYGLQKALKLCFAHLKSYLSKLCFYSKFYDCLLIHGTAYSLIYIVSYGEDILLAGKN